MAELRPPSLGVRVLRFAAGLTLSLLFVPYANASSKHSFAGGYNGTGKAAGMSMVLSDNGEEVYGRLVDGENNAYQLTGHAGGSMAEGHLVSPLTTAIFQIEMQPAGVQFMLIPTTRDGKPNLEAARQYSFALGAVKNPALADFHIAPPRSGETVDITRFLENYRSWAPKEVAYGYAGLSDHDRAIINEFDYLQADLMNRLCRGDAPTASLMTVADREDVDCEELTALVDKAKAADLDKGFNEGAEAQRSELYAVFACNRGLYAAGRCDGVNAVPKRAARDWTPARTIFASVSKLGARSGALVDEVLDIDPRMAKRETTIASLGAAPVRPTIRPPATAAPPVVPSNLPDRHLLNAPGTPPSQAAAAVAPRHVPTPRGRPLSLGASRIHLPDSALVDESVLASADQSSTVKNPNARLSLSEGLGFDLRPTLGAPEDEATLDDQTPAGPARAVAAVRAHPDDVAPPVDKILVPTPRPRPPSNS
jgi:hypothetical protein